MFRILFAVLCFALMLLPNLAKANDVTIVKPTVALVGGLSQVDYSAVLKLKDIGGGFEKYAMLSFNVYQKKADGTPYNQVTVNFISSTAPTLTKNGDVVLRAYNYINVFDANWYASVTMTVYIDGMMKTDHVTGESAAFAAK